jgi:ferredoxin
MALRVVVDRSSCQSSGRCVRAAPEAFSFDEDHLSRATPEAAHLALDRARAIARACPALAIELFAEDGTPIEF